MDNDFFNLISGDLTKLSIQKTDYYECCIKDVDGNIYHGFILAQSPTRKAFTICEINFHKSDNDEKYHPRLVFKRTDEKFTEKKVSGESIVQRISFQKGGDGYREFWRMISFLKGFKDLIDTGNFEDEYRVASDQEVLDYLKKKEVFKDGDAYKKIIDELGIDSASALYFLTTIKLLKSYKEKINTFIQNKSSETDVQNWIDEDSHEHRQDRCMIFGLEFINHKREGGASGDKYDIFTKIGTESEERILIELKSPSDEVFEAKEHGTINNIKKEYSLSPSISRAIPQILEYRRTLEEKRAGDSELQKIGENEEIKISKCIIVIGAEKKDSRWKKNLREFRRSLSSNLEIWTYTDLLNKIDSIIKNLENRKGK
jgi:hypothetical protein